VTPAQLAEAVLAAAAAALTDRGLDLSVLPATTALQRPRNPDHGDYASTLALQLAKKVGTAPRELAQSMSEKLGDEPVVRSVEVAGPGFLNIRLNAAATGTLAGMIIERGESYGRETVDLDLDMWTRRSNDNPVYSVQYAHARSASLLRNAAELGLIRGHDYDPAVLVHDREHDLLTTLGEFPGVVARAAHVREPHRVVRYLGELAGTYYQFCDACRVLPHGDEPFTDQGRARLWLVEAVRIVLANGLGLLGVTAPQRM
jgi:arginyl-tRNA synthetase